MWFFVLFGIGFLVYGLQSLWLYTRGHGAAPRKYKGWLRPRFDIPEYVKPKVATKQNRFSLLLTSLVTLWIAACFLFIVCI